MKKPHAIIPNTKKARDKYGWNYGAEKLRVSKDDVKDLLEGKCWAIDINEGEYVLFISIK
jgi:hypothetical protein